MFAMAAGDVTAARVAQIETPSISERSLGVFVDSIELHLALATLTHDTKKRLRLPCLDRRSGLLQTAAARAAAQASAAALAAVLIEPPLVPMRQQLRPADPR